MTGMTIGSAMAAGLTSNDLGGQGNISIVYGSTAQSMDLAQATILDSSIRNTFESGTGSVLVGADALSESEVTLGGSINVSKLRSPIKNNKLNSLFKGSISWDDGDGEEDYDVHEEIVIDNVKVVTSLADEDFEELALTTVKGGLSYKLVLDDYLNISKFDDEYADAESLYLTILGSEYELVGATEDSITVTTSSEMAMGVGQVYTLSNGKDVKVVSIFSNSVEVLVDGTAKIISNKAKVNGVAVSVESIGYNSNSPESSRVVLKIGEQLKETFSNGDAFIGEDKDEPEWVWSIDDFGSVDGFVGIKYNQRADRAKDEYTKYIGEGYVFPNNYAAVTLDSITDADYQDVKVYFLEREDLYNSTTVDIGTAGILADANILVVEAESKDSIVAGGFETNKIAFYVSEDDVYTFAYDNDGEYSPTKKWRAIQMDAGVTTKASIAEIEVGDTFLNVGFKGISSLDATDYTGLLTISHKAGAEILSVNLSNLSNLDKFGVSEDAESGDIIFSGKDVSKDDTEFMDAYGIKIAEGTSVEAQADNNEVTLSVPEEQVFAKVSVSTKPIVGSVGNMIFKDTETSAYAGKNVVIVGGSCVNSAAAKVLGISFNEGDTLGTCGEEFTSATGAAIGQFLIKKGLLNGNSAIVVAGYGAEDTKAAVEYLIANGVKEGVYTTNSY
jgi:hypothetical protein